MIGILLCVTALLQAQDSVKSFDEFFVAGMDKIDGVFPVYVAEKEIYLEIPEKYIGREIEVSGQIDRGFDLLNRPVDGLGVVRIISPDKATICFQKPFYTERILDEKSTYQQSFRFNSMIAPDRKRHTFLKRMYFHYFRQFRNQGTNKTIIIAEPVIASHQILCYPNNSYNLLSKTVLYRAYFR